jgi:3-oxoacyl-[acyl-carrier protein] reductase
VSQLAERIDCTVVTGAGRGIGAAAARHLARLGVPVLCISRTQNTQSVAREIERDGGKVFALKLDLTDLAGTRNNISEWISGVPYRKLGIVLAAGITGAPGGLLDADLFDWLRTFQTNLLGNLAVLQALLPRMLETQFGRIVMFGGGGAAYAYPLFGGYAASKVAVVRAAENLAVELKTKGDFSVACLAPGAIDTDMLQTIRKAGGEVKTLANMSEPLRFIEAFLGCLECAFTGRFVHVRDDWQRWLDHSGGKLHPQQWFLRRIEP